MSKLPGEKDRLVGEASAAGKADDIDGLIEGGGGVDAWKDMDGNTPLLVATRRGHEAVVRKLVSHKADIAHANYEGNTALHIACGLGYLAIVEFLLTSGAPKDVKNASDKIPSDLICKWRGADRRADWPMRKLF